MFCSCVVPVFARVAALTPSSAMGDIGVAIRGVERSLPSESDRSRPAPALARQDKAGGLNPGSGVGFDPPVEGCPQNATIYNSI